MAFDKEFVCLGREVRSSQWGEDRWRELIAQVEC